MSSENGDPVLRQYSAALAGYLCGTHSGPGVPRASRRRLRSLAGGSGATAVAGLFRSLAVLGSAAEAPLARESWQPEAAAEGLRRRLVTALEHPDIVDLVMFGSQSRRSTTGFSDVDAVLVIADRAACEPRRLRDLRSRVISAQRAVLAYQPMQHHGFEVVTVSMLGRLAEALELPAVALEEVASLKHAHLPASVQAGQPGVEVALRRLQAVADATAGTAWPTHPWDIHRTISMLELAPALYLQARGRSVAKWRSFAEASTDFPGAWSPYDHLLEVREVWPRDRQPALSALTALLRNPWAAVRAWRRFPVKRPAPVRELLTDTLLQDLVRLVRAMAVKAG
jgi:hypothetical protein